MINVLTYPPRTEWIELLHRPAKDFFQLQGVVGEILRDVHTCGDKALFRYEEKFDHVSLNSLVVSQDEIQNAVMSVNHELKESINLAKRNIETFHRTQLFRGEKCLVAPGVECWQRSVAIEKVGLYIPGGSAPLFSTVLMLAIPAKIAGCREIVLCTPPSTDGGVNPVILYAAQLSGVTRIFKIGGAQAIAAMAYGTESVPHVNKIFGPGNQYVTCAKQMVSLSDVAIDMPAGPSEVLVLADKTSCPAFLAADLLSQAEHGEDSHVMLFTIDDEIIPLVQEEIERQLAVLPRRNTAQRALEHSLIVLLHNQEEMMEMANLYAPEHLIIETADYEALASRVVNAGSVFLGPLTPESAGDYASGTNHTLPTNGYAIAYSGVNLDAFCRKITFQHITPEGIHSLSHAVETMAEAEHLDAHRQAMRLRRKSVLEK